MRSLWVICLCTAALDGEIFGNTKTVINKPETKTTTNQTNAPKQYPYEIHLAIQDFNSAWTPKLNLLSKFNKMQSYEALKKEIDKFKEIQETGNKPSPTNFNPITKKLEDIDKFIIDIQDFFKKIIDSHDEDKKRFINFGSEFKKNVKDAITNLNKKYPNYRILSEIADVKSILYEKLAYQNIQTATQILKDITGEPAETQIKDMISNLSYFSYYMCKFSENNDLNRKTNSDSCKSDPLHTLAEKFLEDLKKPQEIGMEDQIRQSLTSVIGYIGANKNQKNDQISLTQYARSYLEKKLKSEQEVHHHRFEKLAPLLLEAYTSIIKKKNGETEFNTKVLNVFDEMMFSYKIRQALYPVAGYIANQSTADISSLKQGVSRSLTKGTASTDRPALNVKLTGAIELINKIKSSQSSDSNKRLKLTSEAVNEKTVALFDEMTNENALKFIKIIYPIVEYIKKRSMKEKANKEQAKKFFRGKEAKQDKSNGISSNDQALETKLTEASKAIETQKTDFLKTFHLKDEKVLNLKVLEVIDGLLNIEGFLNKQLISDTLKRKVGA